MFKYFFYLHYLWHHAVDLNYRSVHVYADIPNLNLNCKVNFRKKKVIFIVNTENLRIQVWNENTKTNNQKTSNVQMASTFPVWILILYLKNYVNGRSNNFKESKCYFPAVKAIRVPLSEVVKNSNS